MKATHHDSDAGLSERLSYIERARVLVCLDANKRDEPEAIVTTKSAQQRRNVDAGVRFVYHIDFDAHIAPKYLALCSVNRQTVDCRQRIGRDQGAPPADDIT